MPHRLTASLAAAVVLMVPACAQPSAESEPEPVEIWCDGRPVLIVRNHSGASVEIVEHRRGSARQTLIGIAGAGTTTFTISPRSDHYYSARRPNRGPTEAAESTRRGRREIEFDRECRRR